MKKQPNKQNRNNKKLTLQKSSLSRGFEGHTFSQSEAEICLKGSCSQAVHSEAMAESYAVDKKVSQCCLEGEIESDSMNKDEQGAADEADEQALGNGSCRL